MTTSTHQPPCTFVATVDTTGTCFIPDTFAEQFGYLCAALDWARVFNTQQNHVATEMELRAAADAARKLAEQCDRFAADAFRQSQEHRS